ncbi:hypothetical protein DCO58_05400 [Helicobacter saguini]|uniref:Uncharacterized protein n=1 Tax=Helicobacter saguini TaxID=1548018 RepID=A0A347VT71_9HELI|nr:hypothetical protein [Helicobacter saguini]MWV62215.1 hypothetical protein [Helicobacter saguini]MWV67112.1 hypothetical protein [Helicobacter saguini]MWV69462.1 hypothetical protein [Helicobacter saguini]MWV70985.1 hypothetical protein [Helicobacter saguini]TLD92931.1 hypothetical protein LS64_009580 [Helicobacter saguini]
MKVLNKLLCISAVTTGLLLAFPEMHPPLDDDSVLKAPKGVLQELYSAASVKQKRQIIQIDFDTKKAVKAQTEKFKQYRSAVEFDIKNLRLDLEEAKADRDSARAADILSRIAKKQEEVRKSKQDEQNLKYLLNEDKIKKINAVLKVK